MHKTVFAAVKGPKGQGLYQFTVSQFGAANRASMSLSRKPYPAGPKHLAFRTAPGAAHPEKQGITKP
jgi:hypothetical protein